MLEVDIAARGMSVRPLALLAVMAALVSSLAAVSCGTEAGTDSARDATVEEKASGTWSIQGFNLPAWWHDDFEGGQLEQSMDRMAATGANWVAIVPTQYMERASSNMIAPEDRGRSATDESVARAIKEAHDRGLKVLLKPHVDVLDGTWRGDIRPDDIDAWFDSYRTMIIAYARMADDHGVEMLCIGNEFASMEGLDHYSRWTAIIEDVRLVYEGQLTYGASLNTFESLPFWSELDYIGLSFYYPLSDAASPSREELVEGWTGYSGYYGEDENWLARVESWQAQWQKPVIFTEIGYRSIDYSARQPWEYESDGAYNGEVQANAFLAAWEVLNDEPWLAGIFWWNWGLKADTCGPGNTDYSVCGKPAEEAVTWIFSGGAAP